MIILDTNVISEPMKTDSAPTVIAWLDRQAAETLYLTAISLAELLVGIAALPDGKRKDGLGALLEAFLSGLFDSRILPFDQSAAAAYAPLVVRARSAGRAIGVADGQIAAIAADKGYIVATRDTGPFLAAGVPVVNPWEA